MAVYQQSNKLALMSLLPTIVLLPPAPRPALGADGEGGQDSVRE